MKRNRIVRVRLVVIIVASICATIVDFAAADDWPMYGRDVTHNAVSLELNPPTDWDIGTFDSKTGKWEGSRNIVWRAKLGSLAFGDPVVADGQIWIGTNNYNQLSGNYDRGKDASVLAGFDERHGNSLFNYDSPRLPSLPPGFSYAHIHDWPSSPLACSPLIEGDLMWFTTNRSETVCLDLGPLKRGEKQPREVWKVDMMNQFGVFPIRAAMMWNHSSSISSYQDRIFVITGNGFDFSQKKVPAPEAPSLICFDKHSGKVLWQDNSPRENIFDGQWSSPLIIDAGGRVQVITPQGDGWLRSFDAMTGALIWKFDINLKTAILKLNGGTRNHFVATPVFYQGRVYIANGQNEQHGEGPGRLVCIDPSKVGDISSELAVDGSGRRLPDARIQIADTTKGDRVIPNPSSGLVWECVTSDVNGNGEIQFGEGIYRTYSNVVIKDGLLLMADFSGLLHCMDAKTGKRHWDYDVESAIFASPLIVDNFVYIADDNGIVSIFRLAAKANQPIAKVNMQSEIMTSPIFANGTLYVANRDTLFAIREEKAVQKAVEPLATTQGLWSQWRGPNRDNISTEQGLLQEWPAVGPPLSWRVSGLGQGISPVSVAGGRIFALSQYNSTEYVRALDEQTGKLLWTTELGAFPLQNPSMRWLTQRPPAVDGERLYAVSLDGVLVCLRCTDGELLWGKSYPTDFKGKSGVFGFSDCPVVHEDALICTPGGPNASIVALDKKTGQVLWKCAVPEAGGTAYSNGVVAELAGQTQFVTLLEKTLVGVDVDNGKLLWRYGEFSKLFLHPHTPLIRNNLITCVGFPNGNEASIMRLAIERSSEGIASRELFLDNSKVVSRYTDDTIQIEDRIYETDTGLFSCFDLTSTTLLWRNRMGARATITYADQRFYFHGNDGKISLIEAGAEAPVLKSEFILPEHHNAQGTTTPVVAGGHLFIREDDLLFRYDIRQESPDLSPGVPGDIALQRPTEKPDAIQRDRTQRSVFVPTPQDVVEKMLEIAEIQPQDLVYDLGSGDGRIVITAAKKFGCRAIGYEIDKPLVELSRLKAKEANVTNLVTIEQSDLFSADLGDADVIAVYLLPQQLEKLIPQLEKMKPGSRVISHQFEIPGVPPDKVVKVDSTEDGAKHTLYLWTLPLKNGK